MGAAENEMIQPHKKMDRPNFSAKTISGQRKKEKVLVVRIRKKIVKKTLGIVNRSLLVNDVHLFAL